MSCDRSMYCDNCGGSCSVDQGDPPPAEQDDFAKGYVQAMDDVLSLIREKPGLPAELVDQIERWRRGEWTS